MKTKLTNLMARIEAAKRLPMLAKASAVETIINEAVALLALLVAEVEHLKQQLNDQRKGQDHGDNEQNEDRADALPECALRKQSGR